MLETEQRKEYVEEFKTKAVRLDHAKRKIVVLAARFFEIPADAVLAAGGGS